MHPNLWQLIYLRFFGVCPVPHPFNRGLWPISHFQSTFRSWRRCSCSQHLEERHQTFSPARLTTSILPPAPASSPLLANCILLTTSLSYPTSWPLQQRLWLLVSSVPPHLLLDSEAQACQPACLHIASFPTFLLTSGILVLHFAQWGSSRIGWVIYAMRIRLEFHSYWPKSLIL